ncbi:MAG TPA: hypothetical protein VG963_22780, partial [Polyangiaceae bacterium]|nr:hypothetical protein [Polyangiaceae bacterium]
MAASDTATTPHSGVILCLDLGYRSDAALVIAALNGLMARGDAHRIALGVTRPSLEAAQLADVIAQCYPGLPAGAPPITIGMPGGAPASVAPPGLAAMLSRKAADATPLYPTRIRRRVDTAEDRVLFRNALLGQRDASAIVLLAGSATSVVRLLELHGAREQIAAKVARLVVAAGCFGEGPPDPSIVSDVAAARRLFAEWPTPIVAVGSEVGAALRYPATSIDQDLAWSPNHPIAAACHLLDAASQGATTAALAALVHAALPSEDYFSRSEPGRIVVHDDGRTRLEPSPGGRCQTLTLAPIQKERLLELYRTLVSARPFV